MKVSHLTDYGIPQLVVDCWQEKLGTELLPVQRKAVVDYKILSGNSLMVASPTSSGKTFCGELAAASVIFKRKKAVFLVPLKSIAEEKFLDFSSKYRKLGIKVVISTRDRNEFDQDLEKGDFDLGILIYEKFNQLLIRNIDLIASVDMILIDEIQMVGESGRGASLELALLKVLSSDYRPQIIALSAVLKNPADLANWLECQLLEDDFRPVALRQGVLTGEQYHYRIFNTADEGKEIFCEQSTDQVEELLQTNIECLVRQGEQVLVFLKCKRGCEQLAGQLANNNFWEPAASTINRLAAEVSLSLKEKLLETLHSAVAFHHADLSHRQRQILEQGFRLGEIKVLVSTTTLAMGVNLPAQSVFIDCYKYQIGLQSGKPMVVPLSWGEYEGMSGRAGRLGGSSDFGRSILIAGSALEEQSMWDSYINGSPDQLCSQLMSRSLCDIALDLVASKTARTSVQLLQLFNRSYYVKQGGVISEKEILTVLERLEQMKLVFSHGSALEASPIGCLISLKGITVGSGIGIISFCNRYSGADRFSWLYAVLSLPDTRQVLPFLDRNEQLNGHYRKRLVSYFSTDGEISPQLKKLTVDDYLISDNQNVRLKSAFLLLDWISDIPTVEIESRYRINVGSILQISERTAWLLDSMSAVASLLNKPPALSEELDRLAIAVGNGCSLPGLLLSALGFKAEQRDLIWELSRKGISSVEQFTQENRGVIAAVLGQEEAERLINKFGGGGEDKNKSGFKEKVMPQLRLRGYERGDRVLIDFGSTEIDLTMKSFRYLFKLIAARLMSGDGWLHKEEIEPGFNQAKNIYRVRQELKQFATGLECCIENNKSGYYRINLLPEQIKINYNSMKSFKDMELADLAKRLQTQLVS